MDFLDIMQGRLFNTYAGKYYEKLPDATLDEEQDAAFQFDYEYIDMTSKTYKHLISNLTECDGVTSAIKTNEQLKWRVGGFVILTDGRLCTIVSVNEDRTNASQEAGRLLAIPLGTEYILRLTEYENPRGIK